MTQFFYLNTRKSKSELSSQIFLSTWCQRKVVYKASPRRDVIT